MTSCGPLLRIRTARTLLLRLLQVGLGLRELGPRAAVGELEHLAIVAARGGRVSGVGRGSRRAGIAAQPVLRAAQRRFEGREPIARPPQLQYQQPDRLMRGHPEGTGAWPA